MTHKDIYTKFMIEYDKADITSSYPSLTKYELATLLDKAYLALIAQKLTGNNPRKVGFEGDSKAIEDIRPLITNDKFNRSLTTPTSSNEYIYSIPQDKFLYYLQGNIYVRQNTTSIDGKSHKISPVKLITHEDAVNFMSTDKNLPWVKTPVCFIESDDIHVLIDPFEYSLNGGSLDLMVTYIKKFNKFAIKDGDNDTFDFGDTSFELSDSMAEELINLTIIIATEVTQDARLNNKINTRPLES